MCVCNYVRFLSISHNGIVPRKKIDCKASMRLEDAFDPFDISAIYKQKQWSSRFLFLRIETFI